MAQQLGKYHLGDAIGAGGMAQVYRARLMGPMGYSKDVAVKLVPAKLTRDETNIHALVNEARIGGQLRHPNIVEVFELDQAEDGTWFVAMELIRGKTMHALLRRCRATGLALPRGIALEIAMQIAAGLQYAHSFRTPDGQAAGLVHRDLKPANVMLTERGGIKVMDFGIARSSLNYYLTTTQEPLKGSPIYMSPEQFEGADLTPATDIWAFGAILYEMLTGHRLFLGRDFKSIVFRVMHLDLEPYLEPIHKRAPHLAELIGRCLERDPNYRPGNAKELYKVLSDLRRDDLADLNLPEFAVYLQQAPELGLVERDPDTGWDWNVESNRTSGVTTDAVMTVSVQRPLDFIGEELRVWGPRFFGPERFPHVEKLETEAAERGLVPGFHASGTSGGWLEALGVGPGPDRSTDSGSGSFDDIDTHKSIPDPPWRGATSSASARTDGFASARHSGATSARRSSSGPASRSLSTNARRGSAKTPSLFAESVEVVRDSLLPKIAIGSMLLLLLATGATLWWLFGGAGTSPDEARALFLAALARGDSQAAAVALENLDPNTRNAPAARLMLATNAALAGDHDEARRLLGDPATLPDLERARAQLLLAGMHRSAGTTSGYRNAAETYAQALDCGDGDDCAEVLERATYGLRTACVVLGPDAPAELCDRVPRPSLGSPAERSLVASVVLYDDGHFQRGFEELTTGLYRIEGGEAIGCAGLEALRVWAASGDLAPGTRTAARVSDAGLAAASSQDDCALFASMGDR